jgi:hypothetical protein
LLFFEVNESEAPPSVTVTFCRLAFECIAKVFILLVLSLLSYFVLFSFFFFFLSTGGPRRVVITTGGPNVEHAGGIFEREKKGEVVDL